MPPVLSYSHHFAPRTKALRRSSMGHCPSLIISAIFTPFHMAIRAVTFTFSGVRLTCRLSPPPCAINPRSVHSPLIYRHKKSIPKAQLIPVLSLPSRLLPSQHGGPGGRLPAIPRRFLISASGSRRHALFIPLPASSSSRPAPLESASHCDYVRPPC